MSASGAVVDVLVWLLLVETLLLAVVTVIGLTWTAVYGVYAIRRLLLAGSTPDRGTSTASRRRARPAGRPR